MARSAILGCKCYMLHKVSCRVRSLTRIGNEEKGNHSSLALIRRAVAVCLDQCAVRVNLHQDGWCMHIPMVWERDGRGGMAPKGTTIIPIINSLAPGTLMRHPSDRCLSGAGVWRWRMAPNPRGYFRFRTYLSLNALCNTCPLASPRHWLVVRPQVSPDFLVSYVSGPFWFSINENYGI